LGDGAKTKAPFSCNEGKGVAGFMARLLMASLLLVGLGGCLPGAASPGEEMVFVPAGAFWMGSNEGDADEGPMHHVYLEAFWIDRYEVTNAQYAEFLNATQGDQGRCGGYICADVKAENPDSHLLYQEGRYVAERGYENHPVTEVSWYGAKAYCEHYGKRLPSEAEWEKAARGTEGATYPWGEEFDPHKLNSDYRVGDTMPV
jgi:formylglycine-generating enzyme required for sulfatase activity